MSACSRSSASGDDLTFAVELVDMADKCAKADEGRLFRHNIPLNEPKTVPPKSKRKSRSDIADAKRKAPAVLAAEPEHKYKRSDGTPRADDRPSAPSTRCTPTPPKIVSSWKGFAETAS